MKLKIISAVLSLMTVAALFSGCGSENSEISESSKSEISESSAVEDITENTAKPVLSLSKTEVSAGETAEITLSVNGADGLWSMCGLHITYPKELVCEMDNEEERTIKYKLGDASENSMGAVGMLWADGLPDELEKNHLGCFFFTEMFSGNQGYDGEIAKFYLKVPDNAESGTVYPISYYFQETDLFTDSMQSKEMQEYAFSNAVDGCITVK